MRGSFTLPCATPSRAPKPSFAISFGPEHLDLQAELAQRLAAIGHLGGVQHVGRLADQIAGEEHAVGDRPQRRPGRLGRAGVVGQQRQLGELRLVLGLLLGAVAVEAVAAQHRAQRQMPPPAAASATAGGDRDRRLARQRRDRVRRPPPPAAQRGQLGGLAEARPRPRASGPRRGRGWSRSCPCAPLNSATSSARLMAPPVASSSPAQATACAVRLPPPAARARRRWAGRRGQRRHRAWRGGSGWFEGAGSLAAGGLLARGAL